MKADSQSPIFLSIIIPAYNEKRNLQANVLHGLFAYLKKQKYSYEVIFSDDGSSDGTRQSLVAIAQKEKNTRVLANHHAGKAQAITAGMFAASGKWRLFTDFDQSTPISEIEKLFAVTQCDPTVKIIFGSREGKQAQRENEPWIRHFMGRVFNWLVRIITLPDIQDTQCGFKLFDGQVARDLFGSLKVYGLNKGKKNSFTGAFDVEIFYLAKKRHIKYQEVPVLWIHQPASLIDRLRDSAPMFFDLLKIRWTDLIGGYNH